jgi:hypothetical protein
MLQTQSGDGSLDENVPELAPLSNRFSYFENFEAKQEEKSSKKKSFRMTPPREGENQVPLSTMLD